MWRMRQLHAGPQRHLHEVQHMRRKHPAVAEEFGGGVCRPHTSPEVDAFTSGADRAAGKKHRAV